MLYRVCRGADKSFWQQRPDGNGGWVNGLDGVRQVLYRLPEVRAAAAAGKAVWICEGEKDVDRLVVEGLTATCNPGSGKTTALDVPSRKGAHRSRA